MFDSMDHSFESVTIHCKAVEQLFTVVLFVYLVCNLRNLSVLDLKLARGFIRSRLLPRSLSPIISINYNDFHNFLGKHALQTPVGKSPLKAPSLPQPPTSQNQPLTIKLIETPDCQE